MTAYHWSVHQMTEYFSAVSGHEDEATTVRFAVERAAEALDAECVAVVRRGRVLGQVGLPAGTDVPVGMRRIDASRRVDLPGLGTCHVSSSERPGERPLEQLVAARQAEPFTAEERQLLRGMAEVLGLALRTVRILRTERALRAEQQREFEERLRLLSVVQARERLLQRLLMIQRAISRRQPLRAVLDAVTAGAQSLMDEQTVVAIVLGTPGDATALVLTSSSHVLSTEQRQAVLSAARAGMRDDVASRRPAGPGGAVAVPVHVGESVAASLVAIVPDTSVAQPDRDLLSAFAQQVSTALTDARTLAQVQQAQHDHLTGLPTRALFLERLGTALRAYGTDHPLTLLFVDLDRFKQVNDSLGHAAGDALLVAVSRRVRACLREADTFARLGGDEFAVLLEGLDRAGSFAVADRITAALREPFRVAGQEVFIACSIGVVEPGPGQDGSELLSHADVAMYRAKKAGGGRAVLYVSDMHAEAVDRLELQGDLMRALGSGELHLAYQPIFDLLSGRPRAVEALLRWTHPVRGAIPPSTFIPLAEETGLIVSLGDWVLQQGARQLAGWREAFPRLTLSVNVSGRQLQERAFADSVLAALAGSGVPQDAVTLELTETVLMDDPDRSASRLSDLRQRGLRIAIDDFGTGYSSLSYLRKLPVDELKIDRAFVAGLGTDDTDAAVVRTICDLARTLGLRTVAEGIETPAQRDVLRGLRCPLGQGFLLSPPLAPSDVLPRLRAAVADPGAAGRSPALHGR